LARIGFVSPNPPSAAQERFADFLEQRTGQRVSNARSWRIDAALRPIVRELGLDSLDALADRLGTSDARLATRVTEALLNNETSFFRDMAMFDAMRDNVLPSLRSAGTALKRLRIWSAGCSTGQEAYSLAMMLADDEASWDGWRIDILGTDVSAATVTRARRGAYSQFEIQRGLPVRTMLRCFTQAGDEWVIDPALKQRVRFGAHNLLDPAPGRFDLILCRNILMYLQPEARRAVFDRLAVALEPGGVLMLGAGETVIGQTERFASHRQWRGLYAAVPKTLSRAA
jgi:chemotaxis protein methyltransferase CheR